MAITWSNFDLEYLSQLKAVFLVCQPVNCESKIWLTQVASLTIYYLLHNRLKGPNKYTF